MLYGGSPYGIMSSGMGAVGGPFNGLNQFLFGVQSMLFSLSQAIQIVGMNTHTFNQIFESATSMFDHAIETFHEMRAIEVASRENETDEMKKRRRRLRTLRWALVTAVTVAGYKIIRRLLARPRRPPALLHGAPYHFSGGQQSIASYPTHPYSQQQPPNPYAGAGGYSGSNQFY
jgi:hypothetical protein